MSIKNNVQLITYADSLGGTLGSLHEAMKRYFPEAVAGGVHILPPFPSSADRGFAPTTYAEINPEFGTWEDVARIARTTDVMVDLMVNHISRKSDYFRDFEENGRQSKYADMFITLDKVWPEGKPDPEDLARIFLRKPENPFSDVKIRKTGDVERIWTSFGTRDWSEQIDLDVNSRTTRDFLRETLERFARKGISAVRLDAIGYVTKKPGTTCFMVEPEIYQTLDWLIDTARSFGLELLPEVHDHYSVQDKLSAKGYWTYDFVLPGLILFTLQNRSGKKLGEYLKTMPGRRFTMLDCHDGIPVQPDLDGVLDLEESKWMVDLCMQRGANLNRILSGTHMPHPGFDAHQINCTYYSALDANDDAYLAARALQFFAPGIPQVYYVGLLAGENDEDAVRTVGEGRAINRHNYTLSEIEEEVSRPVVKRLLELIRFRNTFDAFNGTFSVEESAGNTLALSWMKGSSSCRLDVDLDTCRATMTVRDGDRSETMAV